MRLPAASRCAARSLPLAALLLTPAVVVAQQPPRAASPTTTRDTLQRLVGVTVTATVSGRGQSRGAAAVDSARLHAAPPGTSALKVIEQLPGVNVQGADGFGMYEWANRITMRGFQTAQIGQTMDGVPLGDMSYGNFNGLGVGRAVDPSNLAATVVAQGTGALGTASGNNLGGVVQYASAEPSSRRQFLVQQMAGAYAARRSTLRADPGMIGLGANTLLESYVSLSRFDTDKWKAGGRRYSSFPGQEGFLFGQGGLFGHAGQQWQDQLNARVDLLHGAARLTAFYDYASRKEADYMDLSLGIFDGAVRAPGFAFGPDFDYLGDWAQAKQLAELSVKSYNPLTDASYFWSAQGARQDHLGYLKGSVALGDAVKLEVQPYVHRNRGGGDWHAPSYGAPWSPDPIMFRQTQYRDDRYGALGKLTAKFTTGAATHALEVGGWLESNETRIRRPRWRLANYAQGPEVDFGDVLRLDFDRTGQIDTYLGYAQNTTRFDGGRLAVSYGAKFLRVNADFTNNGNTPTDGVVAPLFADAGRPSLSVPTKGGLLPQVGVVWETTAHEELFANWSENVNQFPYSPSGGVYNASPATFDFFRRTAKPERATTVEGGVRTRRGRVEGGLTGYAIDYRDRLLGIALCPATVTCASGFGNVGSVRTLGAEALLSAGLGGGFRWYSSLSYNRSTYRDDYRANQNDPTSTVATKGKDVVDAPRLLANASLGWSGARDRLGATLGGRYVDKRFFTYTNDLVTDDGRTIAGGGRVAGYGVVDASARYRLGPLGGLRTLDVQVNALNLFDRRYVSTLGTNGFTSAADYQTLLTGAPRQLFVTLGTTF